MSAGEASYVVVYDGACTVCLRTVNRIRDWDRDGRFELVPYQAEGVRERFPDISADEFDRSVQLIGPEGRRWSGAAAVERILALLPRTRALAWVFRIPGVRMLAEAAYRLFAKHRHRFGCGDHCPVLAVPRRGGGESAGAPPPAEPASGG